MVIAPFAADLFHEKSANARPRSPRSIQQLLFAFLAAAVVDHSPQPENPA
jgi:hypothetical protein